MITDLKYCKQLLALDNVEHWEFVCNQINETTDTDYIEIFLGAPAPDNINQTKLQVIRIMYATRTSQPNTIEKTMTALQLFQTQSPFWATGLTLKRINDVLNLQADIKTNIFFENFNKLIESRDDLFHLLVWDLRFKYKKET